MLTNKSPGHIEIHSSVPKQSRFFLIDVRSSILKAQIVGKTSKSPYFSGKKSENLMIILYQVVRFIYKTFRPEDAAIEA